MTPYATRTSFLTKLNRNFTVSSRRLAGMLGVAMLAVIPLVITLGAPSQAQQAGTFYVSPTGNNQDGRTWQSAWSDMDKIDWSKLPTGATIYLDGGASQTVYHHGLSVLNDNVSILRSNETGRNGRVVLDGTNAPETVGINAGNKNNLVVNGRTRDGIEVRNFSTGVQLTAGTRTCSLWGLEIDHNKGTGLNLAGGADIYWSSIHDNGINLRGLLNPQDFGKPSSVTECWIYNRDKFRLTDGFFVFGGDGTAQSNMTINKSIFGPGLRHGVVYLKSGYPQVALVGSLFNNSRYHNVYSPYTTLKIERCTSFMTNLNDLNRAHTALYTGGASGPMGGGGTISRSIFYGGNIKAPLGASAAYDYNTQFNTTGNTTFLSSQMLDPQFASNVSQVSNQATFDELANLNFAASAPSARYSGATYPTINSLLAVPPYRF